MTIRETRIARKLFQQYPAKDGAGNEYWSWNNLIPILKDKYLEAAKAIISALKYESKRL